MNPEIFEIFKDGEFQNLDPKIKEELLKSAQPKPISKTTWFLLILFLIIIILTPAYLLISLNQKDDLIFWLVYTLILAFGFIKSFIAYTQEYFLDFIPDGPIGHYVGGVVVGAIRTDPGKYKVLRGQEAKNKNLWSIILFAILYLLVLYSLLFYH